MGCCASNSVGFETEGTADLVKDASQDLTQSKAFSLQMGNAKSLNKNGLIGDQLIKDDSTIVLNSQIASLQQTTILPKALQAGTEEFNDALKNLDLFVLDNSLRETTVGALRSHTLSNKQEIFNEIRKVGFDNFIVEAFTHEKRVGDEFLNQLICEGEDLSQAFAFSELFEKIDNGIPNREFIPIGLLKCKQFGINNPVIEIDLDYFKIDYDIFTIELLCSFLETR